MTWSHPRHRVQEGRCLGLDRAGNPVCGIVPGQARALPQTCPRPKPSKGQNLGSNRAKDPMCGIVQGRAKLASDIPETKAQQGPVSRVQPSQGSHVQDPTKQGLGVTSGMSETHSPAGLLSRPNKEPKFGTLPEQLPGHARVIWQYFEPMIR